MTSVKAPPMSRLRVGHSMGEGPEAGRDAVRMALGGATPTADDMIVLFTSGAVEPHALHETALEAAGDAPLVGCSAPRAFTSEAEARGLCSAAYIPGDGLSFGVASGGLGDDLAECARAITALARERAGAPGAHSVLMILTDGFVGDQREVVRGAYAVTGSLTPIVGGLAGDNYKFSVTHQLAEGRTATQAMVAVWINSTTPLGVGVRHGWRPVGRPMMVTRAEGNVILELDGRPARDAYLAERGTELDPNNSLYETAPSFATLVMDSPLGLPNASGRYDVRHIMGLVDSGLRMYGSVPEQAVVQVMESDADRLLAGARAAAEEALDQLQGRPARGALAFSCVGRIVPLGKRVGEEPAAIAGALGDSPVCGFFTNGEFARVTGSTGFHNATVAVLVL